MTLYLALVESIRHYHHFTLTSILSPQGRGEGGKGAGFPFSREGRLIKAKIEVARLRLRMTTGEKPS